ncbi:MAG TPA: type I-E CRISPR-associated protein Cas6/Cse3/CasE [Thermoanaerobaculia bacterium]|nr:type I-E CRISPR-associated protein Cas6/Cse3/CasE [Thermoanaerobaculia bacterium]
MSRIRLSPEAAHDRRFWTLFESPYQLHQAIWNLFSDRPDRRRDFLYRLESDGGRPTLYALSDREPRPDSSLGALWQVESRPLRPALRPSDRLRFSLRANPVVTRDGSRHDLVMDLKKDLAKRGVPKAQWPSEAALAQQAGEGWLARRATEHGFATEWVWIARHEVLTFRKPSGATVRLAVCDFEGVLSVTDPERFLAMLRQGLGPAKGFGCGLLLCRRAS